MCVYIDVHKLFSSVVQHVGSIYSRFVAPWTQIHIKLIIFCVVGVFIQIIFISKKETSSLSSINVQGNEYCFLKCPVPEVVGNCLSACCLLSFYGFLEVFECSIQLYFWVHKVEYFWGNLYQETIFFSDNWSQNQKCGCGHSMS